MILWMRPSPRRLTAESTLRACTSIELLLAPPSPTGSTAITKFASEISRLPRASGLCISATGYRWSFFLGADLIREAAREPCRE